MSPASSPENDRASSGGGAAIVRAGRRVFPWRIVVGAVALVVGACVIRPRNPFGTYETIGIGISMLLVALGLGLRAWAVACLGGHTRSSEIEAPRLVTGGPYAFVRNPVYLGSFTLGLGMVGLLQDPWLLVPHLLVFTIFFGVIVAAEEDFLAQHFGEEFHRFRRAVPKLIPAMRPWACRQERPRCWRAARGEIVIALVLVVIYVGFRALTGNG